MRARTKLLTQPFADGSSAPIKKSLDVSFDLARLHKGNFVSYLVKCVSNVRSKSEKCEVLFMKA